MQTKLKTMIVTGAAKGIGAGVTNAFIERGYNVVANSLNITVSTFAATDRLAMVRGDIGDPSTAREITYVYSVNGSSFHLHHHSSARLP
jgi:NAD(P)-dependent dehydrogenase (short-subunit alcohol dehydrogenase family)